MALGAGVARRRRAGSPPRVRPTADHHRHPRLSVLSTSLAAAPLAAVVRAHWHIENRLHWVLDVVLDEDQARARKDHAPENLARLRRSALNVLRANPDQGSTRLGRRLPPQPPRHRLECDRRPGRAQGSAAPPRRPWSPATPRAATRTSTARAPSCPAAAGESLTHRWGGAASPCAGSATVFFLD